MYLGRERYGTKKQPEPPIRVMRYIKEDQEATEELVERIKSDYPEFNDLQARIWEILSRYRGNAGLSADAVRYLASCIYHVTKDLDKLETIKSYASGWRVANEIEWPEGTLGADHKARNELWLAGLLNILDEEE